MGYTRRSFDFTLTARGSGAGASGAVGGRNAPASDGETPSRERGSGIRRGSAGAGGNIGTVGGNGSVGGGTRYAGHAEQAMAGVAAAESAGEREHAPRKGEEKSDLACGRRGVSRHVSSIYPRSVFLQIFSPPPGLSN